MTNLIDNFVRVELKDPEDFLKIAETLTRIGIYSRTNNTVYQSCHILQKKGLYYIVHFKELFLLDGKTAEISEGDLGRRNKIIDLLEQWNLIKLPEEERVKLNPLPSMHGIKVVSFKDKDQYNFETKYTIGKHRKGYFVNVEGV